MVMMPVSEDDVGDRRTDAQDRCQDWDVGWNSLTGIDEDT